MAKKKSISVMWFRKDLRLSDNEALTQATSVGDVLPIYIHESSAPKSLQDGEASQVWLHHSLEKLNASLVDKLAVYSGDALGVFENLLTRFSISGVYWNTVSEPWCQAMDKKLESFLRGNGVESHIYDSNYLWGVDHVLKEDGGVYKVFTAYKNKAYKVGLELLPQSSKKKRFIKDTANKKSLNDLSLLPEHNWYKNIIKQWKVGEKAAEKKLQLFVKESLHTYKQGRDQPDADSTSKLSPHLHFGEISPHRVWEIVSTVGSEYANQSNIDCYLSEIVWREFSRYLLYHFPGLPSKSFNAKFDGFPWVKNKKLLDAWKAGKTGYPLVDAGMRELWQTGYMHNRVRMVVASFLVKNLMNHWHNGRDWFYDCLLDADLANNSASWQWVAGCGADAAPYFRIFNPITQGEKFDKQGLYTRSHVPELKLLPDKYLYKPWEAPPDVLEKAGVVLGKTYPNPIVQLKASRERALAAYKKL